MSIWLIVLIVIAIFGMNVGTVMLLTRSTKMKIPKLKDYTQPFDIKPKSPPSADDQDDKQEKK
jgi:hypothetical protein